MILNATSEYRVLFLYLFLITTIFQTNILFTTNKYHHGKPLRAEGPWAIAPVAQVIKKMLSVEYSQGI